MIQPTRNVSTRRWLSATAAAGFVVLMLATSLLLMAEAGEHPKVATLTITEGELKVSFRDNGKSPEVLSGVATLFHKEVPEFAAFNPASEGGLNFEHIISGHKNPNNSFTPRRGKFELSAMPDVQQDAQRGG